MLERYFKKPCTLHRLHSGPAGPFLDGFAESMCTGGSSSETSASYLYAADHLGQRATRLAAWIFRLVYLIVAAWIGWMLVRSGLG